ncbi:diguanylate cyclase (GGDEF) domain-containing protein [Klenkia brasiliensis]|uniref:Diguanylate cyclase (GGDEF) domain-containing protein n=2 Tax=Klenkia brasiliensis TaxID=333142 RepID=A0A1G7THQ2_9ACTN|nr:diguanylate cyclase (GGDEF) domain-containing protein [Klenkia brasiliensis]
MVETLAVFYAAGTLLGVLVASEADLDTVGRVIAAVSVAIGTIGTAVLLLVRDRVPRRLLDALVAVATVVVGVAVLVPPQAPTALAIAWLASFAVVDSCYFFTPRAARAQLLLAAVCSNGGLLLRGDVPVWTVLALDCVLVALAVVTRRLAARASGADLDPLTGLPNRRSFDDQLQQLVRGDRAVSVALLDLDHFKEINDTAGHEAGDRVLLRMAEEPLRVLPPGAVLARQGGDEFALLLPGLTGAEAVVVVWRVCDALAGIGLSCGVAQYEPGESAAQLVRRADGALYAAKAAGRGRVELATAVRA